MKADRIIVLTFDNGLADEEIRNTGAALYYKSIARRCSLFLLSFTILGGRPKPAINRHLKTGN